MSAADYNLTADFRASEFACRHCGKSGIKLELVERLQELRDAIGRPITITSGYRCAEHPIEKAKGPGPRRHVEGIAADIYVRGMPLFELYSTVVKRFPAFHGIGVNPSQNFIHLDIRPIPAGKLAVVWAYDRSGAQIRWDGRWVGLPK